MAAAERKVKREERKVKKNLRISKKSSTFAG